ncbi:MAG: CBS domain-containing protein [Desulfurococcales archaeon]|nr:CBS domain-containing protein [Desulfurococcales archaeon]
MVRLPRRSIPLLARDIMSTPAITVNENTPLKEVARIMCEKKIGSVVVVGFDGKIRGIITERDMTCAAGKEEATLDMPAWEFMTPDPVTVTPETPVIDVLDKMRDLGVRHIPVVDSEGNPLGMISARDIMAFVDVLMRMFGGR